MTIATETQPQQTEQAISAYRETYLAPYSPQRGLTQEFANRLRGSLAYKGSADLTWPELLTLAHASLATGLNPYIGEIWAIHGYGLMVGRMGWVKKLGEMGEKQSFKSWSQYRLLQHTEYPEHSVPDDAQIAFVCEVRRSDWNKIYTDTLKDLSESMKLDYELIIELLGKPPVARGVGFIRKGEDFSKSVMPISERAKKRAFAQACREFVYLPFDVLAEGDMVDGRAIEEPMVIDGDATLTIGNGPEETRQAPAVPADMPERPMEPEILRDYVRSHGSPAGPGWDKISDKQLKVAGGLLKGLFKGSATQELDAQAYLSYIAGPCKPEDISKKTASVLIDLIKASGDDEWGVSEIARVEAERVLRQVNIEQGQLDMFEKEQATGEPAPAPEPQPETPAEQKPVVKAQPAPAPQVVTGKIPTPEAKSKAKPETKKAPEKPTEPSRPVDDIDIMALKRCSPSSWVTATEMLNKTLHTHLTAGMLREKVDQKLGTMFTELNADAWAAAIEIAQEK